MGTYGSTWQAGGYAGAGSVASLLGTLQGRPALVCGNAAGVFEELDAAKALTMDRDPVVFGVNDVGMYLHPMAHWVSLHGDKFPAWKAVRWAHAKGEETCLYHTMPPFEADVMWEALRPVFALSGYFAMQIAWLMGARPIILCGCPGMQAPRFFEATARPEFGYGNGPAGSDHAIREQLENEMRRLPEFKAAVRSMSGWTAEFFGRPERGD